MNILWVTNAALPEASLLMNEEPFLFAGWLINAAEQLKKEENIRLSIAFPKGGIKEINVLKGQAVDYYPFTPIIGSEKEMIDNQDFLHIIHQSKPDLVHIFGTEYPHTLAMVNVCKKKNIKCVISIQGLVSFIAKHYLNGLPEKVQKHFTFRDIIKLDNLKIQQKRLKKRGEFEVAAISNVNHVIGRTTWDQACTAIINPRIQYHYCNETLRDEFYRHSWNLESCEKYSIFLSQGSYPVKGLHFMLEAMPIVLKRFPNAKLYIGGPELTKSNSFKEKLKVSSYGKYIKDLVEKHQLQEQVVFTGALNEKQICQRYLKSNVFICPSTIENSPNSLGEAMILGVPAIAADVGGIADLIKHREEGFVYQPDAPYMLAHYICEIFDNDQLAKEFSEKAKRKAARLHDIEQNNMRLLEIYQNINGE
ncbi:glycosyltransferase family 4 protein [Bacillus sp. BRMEA1]|uniref:glycosyltransferase family 4 protein n=1 Tax=Neobacillus endophyticus TaxID=2738405 RepID=UPI0015655C51|nr:glycosyltransferase family 4 protein [Neobacillus endophyticus]NRD76330.1 glycosyltransferase family 4 protein [Neobacillus endophyticus]